MKRSVKLIVLIIISLIFSAGCFLFAVYILKQLPPVQEHITQISNYKENPVDKTLSFESGSTKFSEAIIEDSLYYGYRHLYKKDDIYFFSLNKDWGKDKLEDLATELYENTHGDEMKYLEKVVVIGNGGGDAAGSHAHTVNSYNIPLSFYEFFPVDLQYNALYKQSSIYIYGVFEETTVEDLAFVLSHEYGHHYTFHHFALNGIGEDMETEYYKLRSEGTDDIICERESYDNYIDNHKWYLVEIAAEDYVYLMGSETTKNAVEFRDFFQKYMDYAGSHGTVTTPYAQECRNGIPHENISIDLPSDVDGLAQYFYNFVDINEPMYTTINPIGNLDLSVTPNEWFDRYTISWNQPFSDSDVVYTLIAYDMDDNILAMVKTTYGGEEKGYANFGVWGDHVNKPKSVRKLFNFYYEKGEQIRLRVTVTFPDSTVVISDPIEFTY